MSGTSSPLDWETVPLADLLEGIDAGKNFRCIERPPEGEEVGVVKVSAVSWGAFDELESKTCPSPEHFNASYLIEPGDFLISRANTLELVGACVIVGKIDRRLMLSDKILRLKLREDVKRWLMWFLRSKAGRAQIEARASGNQLSMRNISQARLRSIEVPLAPAAERGLIVAAIDSYFSRLDDATATLQRVQRNLERYRASVLKAAVEGRLVPTEAEVARKEGRDYEPASELLKRILVERRRRWEDAELAKLRAKGKKPKDDRWKARYVEAAAPEIDRLPELPEGWCWASPAQLASPERYSLGIGPFGSNLKVSDYRESGVPLIFVRSIRAESFDGPKSKFVSNDKAAALQPHAVQPGDLLITKMGDPPGDSSIYPLNAAPAILTADCIKWRVAHQLPTRAFLLSALRSSVVRAQIVGITKGVAQKKISLERFSTVAIPLPPVSEQARIAEACDTAISTVAGAAADVARVAMRTNHLRQSILKLAFEGRLTGQDRLAPSGAGARA